MLLKLDLEGRARVEGKIKDILDTHSSAPDMAKVTEDILAMVNLELQDIESRILRALDRGAETPSLVNAIKRYEDWTGGEPTMATIRNLSRITDAGHTCRDMAFTLRTPHGR